MINTELIDYTIAQLNVAVKHHYAWAGKLLELNLLGGEVDAQLVAPDSHEHCAFSHWLHTELPNELYDKRLLNEITITHWAMHNTARSLCLAINEQRVTLGLLNGYHEAQQAFIGSIDSYKLHLLTYRNLHDALTGLPLRFLLFQDFAARREGTATHSTQLYLLLLDIDRFKVVNDTWGHNAGDDVLRSVALALQSGTRASECVYRFGGEEFVMLLDAEHANAAATAGRRICRHLENSDIRVGNQRVTITVTGGLTQVLPEETLETAIGRADKAMYYGKNSGRNRCIFTDVSGRMINVSAQVTPAL